MYLDKLSTQGRIGCIQTSYQYRGGLGVSRQVINTGEGWVYLDSYQHRGGLGVSRQVINTGEGWVYLDKLSTQGRVGCI